MHNFDVFNPGSFLVITMKTGTCLILFEVKAFFDIIMTIVDLYDCCWKKDTIFNFC